MPDPTPIGRPADRRFAETFGRPPRQGEYLAEPHAVDRTVDEVEMRRQVARADAAEARVAELEIKRRDLITELAEKVDLQAWDDLEARADAAEAAVARVRDAVAAIRADGTPEPDGLYEGDELARTAWGHSWGAARVWHARIVDAALDAAGTPTIPEPDASLTPNSASCSSLASSLDSSNDYPGHHCPTCGNLCLRGIGARETDALDAWYARMNEDEAPVSPDGEDC
jgi:predicted RNA-binding Zn-ribbon protein involved in translation (DUF1610 family)